MNYIIVGCGRLGAGLAQNLIQCGQVVTVIDKDSTAFARLGQHFQGRTLEGIGFDRLTLHRAGVERCDGLAAVTNSDEANIVIARLARTFYFVPRVIARLYDPQQAEIYGHLGLQTICTTTWGVQRVSELLRQAPLNVVASLGDLDIVEMETPAMLIGRPVRELTHPGEFSVIAIRRNGRAMLADPSLILAAHDVIHVAVLSASSEHLNRILEAIL
jgi:trk system potassium uptake protein TrkA